MRPECRVLENTRNEKTKRGRQMNAALLIKKGIKAKNTKNEFHCF